MPVEIYEFRISKDGLLNLPVKEQEYFLGISHVCNELTILLKMLVITGNPINGVNADKNGQAAYEYFFLKLLIGKIHEIHKIIDDPIIKNYRDSIGEKGIEYLQKIHKFFSDANYIKSVRDYYSFHYNFEKIRENLPGISEDLLMYIDTNSGRVNNLYYFAEVAANTALIKSINIDDNSLAMEKIKNDTMNLVDWILNYCEYLIRAIIQNMGEEFWQQKGKLIELNKIQNLNDFPVSWFIDIAEE